MKPRDGLLQQGDGSFRCIREYDPACGYIAVQSGKIFLSGFSVVTACFCADLNMSLRWAQTRRRDAVGMVQEILDGME